MSEQQSFNHSGKFIQSMEMPLVSIIVRTKNRPRQLQQALQSLVDQTYKHLEAVVINDGGEDISNLCEAYAPSLAALRLVQLRQSIGRAGAANKGLCEATGCLLGFLDDDDWLLPDHIETLIISLRQHPVLLAYSGVRCVAPKDDGTFEELFVYNEEYNLFRLGCENFIPMHAALFDRWLLEGNVQFDEKLPFFEDWDFWLQLAQKTGFHHVDRITAVYRITEQASGLYGNYVLQSTWAKYIYDKWRSRWSSEQVFGMLQYARQVPQLNAKLIRLEANLVRLEANLAASQEKFKLLCQKLEKSQEHNYELEVHNTQLDEENKRLNELLERCGKALQSVKGEYDGAMTLLRQEQFSVVRPLLRHAKHITRHIYNTLPIRWRKLIRSRLLPLVEQHLLTTHTDAETDRIWIERVLTAHSDDKSDIIVFPIIDWHFRIQRPQHFARQLGAKGHRVFYLSTTFFRSEADAGFRILESPADNVFLVQLGCKPPHPRIYEEVLDERQRTALAGALYALRSRCNIRALISIVDLPFWRPLAVGLSSNLVIYDCMDYHAGFSTNSSAMLEEEHRLVTQCDLIVTSSTRLHELMEKKAPTTPKVLIRNGAEVDFFARQPNEVRLSLNTPIIGYFGAISDWFAIDLVITAANRHPEWSFVLIGCVFGCDVSEAKKLSNILFTGELPYAELPSYLYSFDVCIIPFKLNELTVCTNPVKVYEYLSAGKPVVATSLPELEAIGEQIYLATDAEDFIKKLESALSVCNDFQLNEARRQWAWQNSWAARIEHLEQTLAAYYPKVSVIILTYNNLNLTKACLESIEHYSDYPNLELILVDNASQDETQDFLRQYVAEHSAVKIILNDKNVGFAAGNNIGLAAATGDYLILLNNDTYVSRGWIRGLIRPLMTSPDFGLVGPVTNNIGNEAKINILYGNMEEMQERAAEFTARHARQLYESRVLAFFCVAMPQRVYQEVGGLDESFGLGFFEDDDYCNRVRQHGYRLAIVDDVFVHHHLSAGFNEIDEKQRKMLFEQNKKHYEDKWGYWSPHKYRN